MPGHHLQPIKADALEVGFFRGTSFAGDSNVLTGDPLSPLASLCPGLVSTCFLVVIPSSTPLTWPLEASPAPQRNFQNV